MTPGLLHLENSNDAINSSSDEDEKAVHDKLGSLREEVTRFRRNTFSTPDRHAGNQAASQSVGSRVERRDQDQKLPSTPEGNPENL